MPLIRNSEIKLPFSIVRYPEVAQESIQIVTMIVERMPSVFGCHELAAEPQYWKGSPACWQSVDDDNVGTGDILLLPLTDDVVVTSVTVEIGDDVTAAEEVLLTTVEDEVLTGLDFEMLEEADADIVDLTEVLSTITTTVLLMVVVSSVEG